MRAYVQNGQYHTIVEVRGMRPFRNASSSGFLELDIVGIDMCSNKTKGVWPRQEKGENRTGGRVAT